MLKFTGAIRKHPVGMKPKIGKGSASPPQSAANKATSLRLLRSAPFGLKAEVLNQQGRLINSEFAIAARQESIPARLLNALHLTFTRSSFMATVLLQTHYIPASLVFGYSNISNAFCVYLSGS